MVVFAEHRYFGRSQPFGNLSLTPENVVYLTVEQVLADLAALIPQLQPRFGCQRPPRVVTFGGSYGGLLAALFRLKYPHLSLGSIASSSGIFLFPGLHDLYAFNRLSTQDYSDVSKDCSKAIRNTWKHIFATAREPFGLERLSSTFRLCKQLHDVDDLVTWLMNGLQYMSMFDYPYEVSFSEPRVPAWPVRAACSVLTSYGALAGAEEMDRLRDAVGVYYNSSKSKTCFDLDEGGSDLQIDGWTYLTCTEMITPTPSNGVDDMYPPRPWNRTQDEESCKKAWGSRVTMDVEWARRYVSAQAQRLPSASNIVFSEGLLDPSRGGGVTKELENSNPNVHVELISFAGHHLDLRRSHPRDPDSVRHARLVYERHISDWLRITQ